MNEGALTNALLLAFIAILLKHMYDCRGTASELRDIKRFLKDKMGFKE